MSTEGTMNLSRSATKALAETPANMFKLMLETCRRDCPGDSFLDPNTITLLTSVPIRGIAVAQFQRAFGLKVDSHPGAATFAALWELNKPFRRIAMPFFSFSSFSSGVSSISGSGSGSGSFFACRRRSERKLDKQSRFAPAGKPPQPQHPYRREGLFGCSHP